MSLEAQLRLPLTQFSLEVEVTHRGRALAVLGPSGAGKTSFLECLCGLRPRATGRLVVDGRVLLDGERSVPPELRRIGYVPQDALLFPHLTVEGNVRFGAHREDAVAHALELTGTLALKRQHPRSLSGGERQRVALARALASEPKLLVLDEPLASLDAALRDRIFPYLLKLRDEAQVPLVYVTHHWGEARLLADEVLLLEEGKLRGHGPAQALLSPHRLLRHASVSPLENLLAGVVEGPGHDPKLKLPDGTLLSVPWGAPPGPGVYAVSADDVLVATESLSRVSARNVIEAQVESVAEAGEEALVRLRAAGLDWLAQITAHSVRRLGLLPRGTAWLVIKTHSFRRVGDGHLVSSASHGSEDPGR